MECVVCGHGRSRFFVAIDGYAYYACDECESIHADPALIDQIDRNLAPIRKYDKEYWRAEKRAAVERAEGLSLCRAGEAILCCRRPVRRFLDIGAGPGFLVAKLQGLLDPEAEIFHGVEKFPPPYASETTNLHIGDIHSLTGKFDAGTCIEVIEHLTPKILDNLIEGLAKVSQPGSFWLFNTGMPEYVRKEDPSYLDPLGRGHIVSYSPKGLEPMFASHGFRIGELPGMTFAFYAEFEPEPEVEFSTRFYAPVKENEALLKRHGLLYVATLESARSYYYQNEYMRRTVWAMSLEKELREAQRILWRK